MSLMSLHHWLNYNEHSEEPEVNLNPINGLKEELK